MRAYEKLSRRIRKIALAIESNGWRRDRNYLLFVSVLLLLLFERRKKTTTIDTCFIEPSILCGNADIPLCESMLCTSF